jgi:thioredoxin 1
MSCDVAATTCWDYNPDFYKSGKSKNNSSCKMQLELFLPYLRVSKTDYMNALEITDENFEQLVLQTDKPVLIDFWAAWCGPCLMMGKAVDDIAQQYDGKAVVGKINVDKNPELSVRFGVTSLPLVLYMKNGEVVDRISGAAAGSVLSRTLAGHL